MKFAVHHVVALIATTIVVVVATVAVVMITAIVAHPLGMMIASAPTGVVMTMLLAALTAMPLPAVKIATAAVVEMIDVVDTTIERAVARATLPHMATRRLLGMLATHMEVEFLKPVPTIGSPVDRLRSADLFRCGAPSQVMRKKPVNCSLDLGPATYDIQPSRAFLIFL